jgi:hypothetical protein
MILMIIYDIYKKKRIKTSIDVTVSKVTHEMLCLIYIVTHTNIFKYQHDIHIDYNRNAYRQHAIDL